MVIDVGSSASIEDPLPLSSNLISNDPILSGPRSNPYLNRMMIRQLCALPPEKGNGLDDLIRYYFNPIVQQCIPFSYSGTGGNANRFVSVKNCYEICHPAEPTVQKPRVISSIKSYLVSNWQVPNDQTEGGEPGSQGDGQPSNNNKAKDVIVRRMKNPYYHQRTLTLVQPVNYLWQQDRGARVIDERTGLKKIVPTKKPKIKYIQRVIRYPGESQLYEPEIEYRSARGRSGRRRNPLYICN